MKNRIIEICELGQPQSIIQRENEPITELIKTDSLIEELNEQLLSYNVVGQSEQFYCNDEKHYPEIGRCNKECNMCKDERLKQ